MEIQDEKQAEVWDEQERERELQDIFQKMHADEISKLERGFREEQNSDFIKGEANNTVDHKVLSTQQEMQGTVQIVRENEISVIKSLDSDIQTEYTSAEEQKRERDFKEIFQKMRADEIKKLEKGFEREERNTDHHSTKPKSKRSVHRRTPDTGKHLNEIKINPDIKHTKNENASRKKYVINEEYIRSNKENEERVQPNSKITAKNIDRTGPDEDVDTNRAQTVMILADELSNLQHHITDVEDKRSKIKNRSSWWQCFVCCTIPKQSKTNKTKTGEGFLDRIRRILGRKST